MSHSHRLLIYLSNLEIMDKNNFTSTSSGGGMGP